MLLWSMNENTLGMLYFFKINLAWGNGNPLQCSCLENPRDGGAWWAAVHGSHRVGHDWSDLAAAAVKCLFVNNDKLLPSCVTITNTLRRFSHFPPIVAIEAISSTGRKKKKKNLSNIRLLSCSHTWQLHSGFIYIIHNQINQIRKMENCPEDACLSED